MNNTERKECEMPKCNEAPWEKVVQLGILAIQVIIAPYMIWSVKQINDLGSRVNAIEKWQADSPNRYKAISTEVLLQVTKDTGELFRSISERLDRMMVLTTSLDTKITLHLEQQKKEDRKP